METKNKFNDISGEKGDGEKHICMGEENIIDLKTYASSPSRWRKSHVSGEYFKTQDEAVAVKRGWAENKSASRAISKKVLSGIDGREFYI